MLAGGDPLGASAGTPGPAVEVRHGEKHRATLYRQGDKVLARPIAGSTRPKEIYIVNVPLGFDIPTSPVEIEITKIDGKFAWADGVVSAPLELVRAMDEYWKEKLRASVAFWSSEFVDQEKPIPTGEIKAKQGDRAKPTSWYVDLPQVGEYEGARIWIKNLPPDWKSAGDELIIVTKGISAKDGWINGQAQAVGFPDAPLTSAAAAVAAAPTAPERRGPKDFEVGKEGNAHLEISAAGVLLARPPRKTNPELMVIRHVAPGFKPSQADVKVRVVSISSDGSRVEADILEPREMAEKIRKEWDAVVRASIDHWVEEFTAHPLKPPYNTIQFEDKGPVRWGMIEVPGVDEFLPVHVRIKDIPRDYTPPVDTDEIPLLTRYIKEVDGALEALATVYPDALLTRAEQRDIFQFNFPEKYFGAIAVDELKQEGRYDKGGWRVNLGEVDFNGELCFFGMPYGWTPDSLSGGDINYEVTSTGEQGGRFVAYAYLTDFAPADIKAAEANVKKGIGTARPPDPPPPAVRAPEPPPVRPGDPWKDEEKDKGRNLYKLIEKDIILPDVQTAIHDICKELDEVPTITRARSLELLTQLQTLLREHAIHLAGQATVDLANIERAVRIRRHETQVGRYVENITDEIAAFTRATGGVVDAATRDAQVRLAALTAAAEAREAEAVARQAEIERVAAERRPRNQERLDALLAAVDPDAVKEARQVRLTELDLGGIADRGRILELQTENQAWIADQREFFLVNGHPQTAPGEPEDPSAFAIQLTMRESLASNFRERNFELSHGVVNSPEPISPQLPLDAPPSPDSPVPAGEPGATETGPARLEADPELVSFLADNGITAHSDIFAFLPATLTRLEGLFTVTDLESIGIIRGFRPAENQIDVDFGTAGVFTIPFEVFQQAVQERLEMVGGFERRGYIRGAVIELNQEFVNTNIRPGMTGMGRTQQLPRVASIREVDVPRGTIALEFEGNRLAHVAVEQFAAEVAAGRTRVTRESRVLYNLAEFAPGSMTRRSDIQLATPEEGNRLQEEVVPNQEFIYTGKPPAAPFQANDAIQVVRVGDHEVEFAIRRERNEIRRSGGTYENLIAPREQWNAIPKRYDRGPQPPERPARPSAGAERRDRAAQVRGERGERLFSQEVQPGQEYRYDGAPLNDGAIRPGDVFIILEVDDLANRVFFHVRRGRDIIIVRGTVDQPARGNASRASWTRLAPVLVPPTPRQPRGTSTVSAGTGEASRREALRGATSPTRPASPTPRPEPAPAAAAAATEPAIPPAEAGDATPATMADLARALEGLNVIDEIRRRMPALSRVTDMISSPLTGAYDSIRMMGAERAVQAVARAQELIDEMDGSPRAEFGHFIDRLRPALESFRRLERECTGEVMRILNALRRGTMPVENIAQVARRVAEVRNAYEQVQRLVREGDRLAASPVPPAGGAPAPRGPRRPGGAGGGTGRP